MQAALRRLLDDYTSLFARTKDDYLRERLADVRDVVLRLSSELTPVLKGNQSALKGPLVLIADELSLGLAPIIVDEIYRHLDRLRADGTALLIVEQQIGHALDLCDRVVLLDHGSVTWEGPATEAGARVVRDVFHHGAVG